MSQVNRRSFLAGGAALSSAIWVAPSVASIDRIAAASGSAESLIIDSTGVTILDPAPSNMALNAFESDITTFVVPESGCVTLPTNIVVNRQTPGSFDGGSNELVTITAGTSVASFYIHADLANSGSLLGSLTFSSAILGLIYEAPQFQATTPILGCPGITYPTPAGAFIETNDDFVLTTNTISWNFAMGGVWSDVMRVIVAC